MGYGRNEKSVRVNLFPYSLHIHLLHSTTSLFVIPAKAGNQEDLSYNRKHTYI